MRLPNFTARATEPGRYPVKLNKKTVPIKKSMLMAPMLYKWLLISGLSLTSLAGTGPALPAPEAQTGSILLHPFYISVTEVNHSAPEKTLQVSVKTFAEDIEKVLETNYKTALDISKDADKANFERLLPDYLTKHLAFTVDGKRLPMKFLGFEKDKESVWCYFQVDNVAALKKLDIANTILYDLTEDQINIMHVTANGKRQSTKLNYPERNTSLSW